MTGSLYPETCFTTGDLKWLNICTGVWCEVPQNLLFLCPADRLVYTDGPSPHFLLCSASRNNRLFLKRITLMSLQVEEREWE